MEANFALAMNKIAFLFYLQEPPIHLWARPCGEPHACAACGKAE